MKSTDQLRRDNPTMELPIKCENGCGAVIELAGAYTSYKRGEDGEHLLICECCASEEGHIHEELETPEVAPLCHRQPKKRVDKGDMK